jgi:beta-lactamase regulating signal transducer with metallopeptidase domain
MSEDTFLSHWPVGHLLLTLAWQSTLWLALGLVVSRLLRRHAARGHLVLMLTALAAILSPVSTIAVRHMDWGLFPAGQSAADISATSLPAATLPLVEQSHLAGEQKALPLPERTSQAHVSNISDSQKYAASESSSSANGIGSTARFDKSVPAALAACWFVASFVLAVRLAVSLRAGHRIARAARAETSPTLLTALRETARALGLRSAPDLRVSAQAQCPMIWCWGSRPVLLVPESAAQSGGVNWRSVFCHELAHLVRRDHWSALWAEVLVIALPWQPLAWRSRRRLAALREQACDDWVLAAGGNAIDYAESLVNLVPQRSLTFALPALRSGESLEHRLSHILRGVRVKPTVGQGWLAIACLMLSAMMAGIALAQEQSATAPGEVDTRQPATATDGSANVSGRVLDKAGRPLAGAHVAAIAWRKAASRGGDLDARYDVLCETSADAVGRFHLRIAGASPETHEQPLLMVRAEGYGLAATPFNLSGEPVPVTLSLPKEHVLRARMVDLQGQPAAGVEASVVQLGQGAPKWIPQYGWESSPGMKHPAVWPRATVSDPQGRIEIHGLPPATTAILEIPPSDRFARQNVTVHPGRLAKILSNMGKAPSGAYQIPAAGDESVVPLAPAQTIEGVVQYADTKRPVPHARMTAYASQQPLPYGSFLGMPDRADARGRFRIRPYPGVSFKVAAYAPAGEPYLTREKSFDWKAGTSTVHIDIELPRGALVRGRVVEAQSGKPIPHASIEYLPDAKTSAKIGDEVITGWQATEQTDSRGGFALTVPRGSGHLLIYGPTGEFVAHVIGGRELSGIGRGGQRTYAHAIVPVKAAPDTPLTEMTISLQRGATVSGRLVTPDGVEPKATLLVGRLVNISSLSPMWRANPEIIRGAQFSLSGCSPGEETSAYFLDPERHLGATLRLHAVIPGTPLTVRLEPCGTAKARFVDAEGKPIADFSPALKLVVTPGPDSINFSAARAGAFVADTDFVANIDRKNYWNAPKTDDAGRVTFPVLIPGADYRILHGLKESVIEKDFRVQAGQTLDLGDIEIDRPRGL